MRKIIVAVVVLSMVSCASRRRSVVQEEQVETVSCASNVEKLESIADRVSAEKFVELYVEMADSSELPKRLKLVGRTVSVEKRQSTVKDAEVSRTDSVATTKSKESRKSRQGAAPFWKYVALFAGLVGLVGLIGYKYKIRNGKHN